jgi:hypothetical protein
MLDGKGLPRKRLTGAGAAVLGLAVLACVAAPAAHADRKRGSVSVPAAAFSDDTGDEDCRVATAAFAIYRSDPEAGAEDCDMKAPIALPDGADLVSLDCTVSDGHTQNAMTGHLVRVNLVTGVPESVFVTNGSGSSGAIEILGDGLPAPGTSTVDDAAYAYYIAIAFSGTDFTNAGLLLRVYGCTVAFE